MVLSASLLFSEAQKPLSIQNIGTQGVQELFFCELKGFGDSRIKSMTCKMSY